MLTKIKIYIILILSLFLFSGCSTHIVKSSVKLPSNKTYAIGSFWNYTETPMAGLRASSIVEGVLSQESSVAIYSMVEGNEETHLGMTKSKNIAQQAEMAKIAKANYLITGEVQEWRYKTGIDGEPVVSYTLKVIDLKSDQVVFSGVGAKSGWGHKSIGVVAQEVAKELIPQFIN